MAAPKKQQHPNSRANLEKGTWKKGQSGNPSGCPKGKKVTTILSDIMSKKISIKEIDKRVKSLATVKGKGAEVEAREALALKMFALAMDGDAQIIKEVLNRLEGKVVDKVKIYPDAAKQYDYTKLTAKELETLEKLLTKCAIIDEDPGREI